MPLNKYFFERIAELKDREEIFAIATVIMVKGSSSGKVGDKAIYREDGKRILGYIGGGCIENRVAQTARESFRDGVPRIVNIDLDSDEMGMGIPCGGNMSVIVEPQLKTPLLLIRGMGRVVEALTAMGHLLNFRVVVQTPEEEIQHYTRRTEIITEPLDLDGLEFTPDYFILATHHRDDDKMSLQALQKQIPYVAVVASTKKTGIIVEYLRQNGIGEEDLERFHAPAGLDLGARSAEEIALSIISEIVMLRNQGTGQHLRGPAVGTAEPEKA